MFRSTFAGTVVRLKKPVGSISGEDHLKLRLLRIGGLVLTSLTLVTIFENCSRFSREDGASVTSSSQSSATIDGKTFYVDSSGSDANSGTSVDRPWATLARVNSGRFSPGDAVLFRGGDTFTGCLTISTTNLPDSSADAGLSLDAFGDGMYTIKASCSGYLPDGSGSAAITLAGVSGIKISHAILRGATESVKGTPYGIYIFNPSASTRVMSNLNIADNDIGGFYSTESKKYGGEIFFNTYFQKTTSIDHVYIGHNKLHGLNGPASPDENGMMSIARMANIEHVTIERNLIYDIGGKPLAKGGLGGCEGNGLVALGMKGALIKLNVAHDLGGNSDSCGGPGGIWMAQSDDVTIENNEVYRVRPLTTPPETSCDWVAFDFDYSVTNSKIQYNYSHDNYGAGLLLFGAPGVWGPNEARYNVSVNDARSRSALRNSKLGGISVGGYNATMALSIYNNTVFQAEGINPLGANSAFSLASQSVVPTGFVANNLFYHDAHAPGQTKTTIAGIWTLKNGAGLTFLSNGYFSSLYTPETLSQKLWVSMASTLTLDLWLKNGVDRDQHALIVNPRTAPIPAEATTCFANETPQTSEELGACLANEFPSLTAKSPAHGAGVDLSTKTGSALDVVTGFDGVVTREPRDFFGHTVADSTFNVGADGR